jgi:hypothetical protein
MSSYKKDPSSPTYAPSSPGYSRPPPRTPPPTFNYADRVELIHDQQDWKSLRRKGDTGYVDSKFGGDYILIMEKDARQFMAKAKNLKRIPRPQQPKRSRRRRRRRKILIEESDSEEL